MIIYNGAGPNSPSLGSTGCCEVLVDTYVPSITGEWGRIAFSQDEVSSLRRNEIAGRVAETAVALGSIGVRPVLLGKAKSPLALRVHRSLLDNQALTHATIRYIRDGGAIRCREWSFRAAIELFRTEPFRIGVEYTNAVSGIETFLGNSVHPDRMAQIFAATRCTDDDLAGAIAPALLGQYALYRGVNFRDELVRAYRGSNINVAPEFKLELRADYPKLEGLQYYHRVLSCYRIASPRVAVNYVSLIMPGWPYHKNCACFLPEIMAETEWAYR